MLKIYDVICEDCGKIQEQWIDTNKQDDFDNCKFCGGKTKRTFTSFNFKLIYNNQKDSCGWAYNNYASSRYWDDVNKERSKGKNVRPYNEK